MSAPTRQVPLVDRSGAVVAWATVDAEDYDRVVAAGRWSLQAGYAVRTRYIRSEGGRQIQETMRLHRFVLGFTSADPRLDHRDRNRLNNTKANLRPTTQALNCQNRGSKPGSTSRHRGVAWYARDRRWRATVALNGKAHHLGYFDDEEDAAAVAAAFRREHMPFSADAA